MAFWKLVVPQPEGHVCSGSSQVCMCFLRSLNLNSSLHMLHLKFNYSKWFLSNRDKPTQIRGLILHEGQEGCFSVFSSVLRQPTHMKFSHLAHFFNC